MSERKVAIPDVVTTELQTYIQELEDYENGNWDMNYLNEGDIE